MRLSQFDVNINHVTNILKQTPQTIYTTRPLPMQHLENSGIGHHQHFHCHSLTIISYTKTFNLHLKQQGSTSYFIQSNNIGQNFKTPSLWLLLSKIDTKFSDSFLRFIHQKFKTARSVSQWHMHKTHPPKHLHYTSTCTYLHKHLTLRPVCL